LFVFSLNHNLSFSFKSIKTHSLDFFEPNMISILD
jgi:hypothetical protein